jgi:hypothetical protein
MRSAFYRKVLPRLGLAVCLAAAFAFLVSPGGKAASPVGELTPGKVQLQSASALAFGPDGVLFVADSIGGSVVALDTNDRTAAGTAPRVNVQGIDAKIAAMLGTTPDQIMVNDLTVNPISKNAYLAVSRGRGPDAVPVIVSVDGTGRLTQLSLDNIRHSALSLSDAPASDPSARRDPRMETVTDMDFTNGKLYIAGLSSEEWASALRAIPFPFDPAGKATTNIQIWHASHGRFETNAPVRTFVPYTIQGQPHILAAYTCTPLVKIPVSDLKPGAQIKPVTIADVGSGNQPLDMVPYRKDGREFILISNSRRGVMKMNVDNIETYKAVDSPEQPNPENGYIFGMPYDTVAQLTGVTQLAGVDAANAMVLSKPAETMNLTTIALP